MNKAKISRVIVLCNGNQVSLKVYTQAWKSLLHVNPESMIKGFDYWPCKAEEVLREIRKSMNDRINKYLPYYRVGRKWESEYYNNCYHTALRVNSHFFVRNSEIFYPLRDRLKHRISSE